MTYRVSPKKLSESLGLDDIISVLQQNRMRWYGHGLRKEDINSVKKCMEYEVECVCVRACKDEETLVLYCI